MQDYDAIGGVTEGGADNSDSDDYDPSATLHEDYSVPFDVLQEKSTADVPDPLVSEDTPVSHPLASAMQNRPSSTTTFQDSFNMKQFPSPNVSAQTQPRTKGGFVVDDDDDENDDDEDAKDVLDVYDTPDEPKAESPAPTDIPQPPNSSSISHIPIHEATETAGQQTSVSGGNSGVVVPSPATAQGSSSVAPRGSTVTPIQTSLPLQTNFVPNSISVTATPVSAVPKTRLAHDTIGILEDRVKEDPRGNLAAWLELIHELKSRNKKEDVRNVYDRFLKKFPLAVSPTHQMSNKRG